VFNAADPFNISSAVQPASAVGIRPNGPQARITVVDASSPLPSSTNAVKSTAPVARLKVVENGAAQSDAAAKAPDAATPADKPIVETTPTPESNASTLSDALKGLAGTWKAVARRGDGELTTVELRLDDRGWAELTVPGADGKPSTIKRRAELKGDELKLTGPDAELLLGQLIDVNSRQMVLARAGGQVTFVRP
jgi:hypothetical protein